MSADPYLDCRMGMGRTPTISTVREYLLRALARLWIEGEGFSPKRPLGNSDWQRDIYRAFAEDGLMEAERDEHGEITGYPYAEQQRVDAELARAIEAMS